MRRPPAALRRWFGHDPDRWKEFKRRYFAELRTRKTALDPIRERIAQGPVTFVFGARERTFNNAVALKEHLERGDRRRSG